MKGITATENIYIHLRIGDVMATNSEIRKIQRIFKKTQQHRNGVILSNLSVIIFVNPTFLFKKFFEFLETSIPDEVQCRPSILVTLLMLISCQQESHDTRPIVPTCVVQRCFSILIRLIDIYLFSVTRVARHHHYHRNMLRRVVSFCFHGQ
jgi:hypothetical protein